MWTTIMNRVILSTIVLLTLVPTLAAQSQPSYAKQVRPFLAKYCLECHNAKSAKLGLNLETVKAILEGSDGGPVLEPGKPDESRIVLLVEGKDKPIMPPKEAKFHPTKAEIGMLRAWIAAGAKDDSAAINVTLPDIKPRKHAAAPVSALAYGGNLAVSARGSDLRYHHTMDHADGLKSRFLQRPTDVAQWPERGKWWPDTDTPRISALTAVGTGNIVLGVGSAGKWGALVV